MTIEEIRKEYPHAWLPEYIDKCQKKEILVGEELLAEFEILIDNFNNPNYGYDTSESDIRIKFIENECKFYEAPFAGKPFLLTLRQKAFIECLYSFKVFDEEVGRKVRLYQECLLLTARKCGKTPLISAICLAEWFCGEKGTKILLSSNNYEQAALMFDAINAMREESPKVSKVTRKNIKGIYFGNPQKPKYKGKFSYQNKGSITKISAKTGAKDGKNIKVGAVDEVHELQDNSSIMPIRQALSTQDEPIYLEISTEGFTENGYLDARIDEARKVLKGEIYNPRWMVWLYTQDSEEEIWQDEKTWTKSNPDLGTIKKWSFLRQKLEEAKHDTQTRSHVLAKDFNIKQAKNNAWLQESDIVNTDTFSLEDFRERYCIYGNDFAETTDLCSTKGLIINPDEPDKVYMFSHYWIPRTKLADSPDDIDYTQWERDGYLTIVDGSIVESSMVAEWQYEIYKAYGIKPYKSGYDDRFAKDYLRRFEELFSGGKTTLVNVPQDFKCLSNPMRQLESDLKTKRVNYNNCFADYWCFKNTGYILDKIGRIMPCKLETKKRIDGTAAALCCYAVLGWHKSEYMQVLRIGR